MTESVIVRLPLIILIALILNIPLGLWRVKTQRFTLKWIISIHLAIPLIFVFRTSMDLSYRVIPVLVLSAVMGQIIGGQIDKRLKSINLIILRPKKKSLRKSPKKSLKF